MSTRSNVLRAPASRLTFVSVERKAPTAWTNKNDSRIAVKLTMTLNASSAEFDPADGRAVPFRGGSKPVSATRPMETAAASAITTKSGNCLNQSNMRWLQFIR